MRNKKGNLGMAAYDLVFIESGRQDSNLRPSAPKASGQNKLYLTFLVISTDNTKFLYFYIAEYCTIYCIYTTYIPQCRLINDLSLNA